MARDPDNPAQDRSVMGTGELAGLVRDFPWSSTSLGPIRAWPRELLSLVNVILSSPLPMLLYWGPDVVVMYNDAARPIASSKHPQALGAAADQVFKEAWHIIGPEIERVLLTGESVSREGVLVPLEQDGRLKELYWNYSYTPVYVDGSVCGVLVVCADVTARKAMEDALISGAADLRKNEEKLRTFIDAVSDVVYRVSADWSQALQVEGRGFLPDTHAPDPEWFTRNVHPEDQARVRAAIETCVRKGSVFELEHQVQRLDGTPGWTFSRAIPVRDEGGAVVEWYGAASDITARNRPSRPCCVRKSLPSSAAWHRPSRTKSTTRWKPSRTFSTWRNKGQTPRRRICWSRPSRSCDAFRTLRRTRCSSTVRSGYPSRSMSSASCSR